MPRLKYFNQNSGKWEYADNGRNANSTDIANIKTVLGNTMTILKAQVEDKDGTPQGYNMDVSGLVTQNDTLIAALGSSDNSSDTEDGGEETEKTLTGISATYTGGNVAVGSAVTDLTGITVKATYSDGSTATVTGYTLSGTIADGENTITVTYQGKTATFTVTGISESTGENNGWNEGEAYAIEWTDGYKVDNSTGENVADTARSVSGFIPCMGASSLVGGAGINGGYLFAYDADYTYLGRITFNAAYPTVVNRNVAYVKMHCLTTDKEEATLTPHVYAELTENTAWEAGEYYQASYIEGMNLNGDTGVISSKDGYWVSDYMFCYGATSITTTQLAGTVWRNACAFFDADRNCISSDIGNVVPWEVPENAVYFCVGGINGYEYGIQKPNRPWIQLA